ncbi:MAG: phosphotransferase family protein [Candidatus Thorarchaeota archaeon]|jgi:aminoglycoside 2''-phosphotransferase
MMYEENVPPDIELSVVESIIQRCLPSITSPTVRFLYHGTHNVYEIEGRYIFRFPSTFLPAKVRSKLVRRETEVLNGLKDHITVKIPSPMFVDADSETPYMGYQKITGSSLTGHYSNVPIKQRRSIAEQVGRFLGELHDLDLADISPGAPDSPFDPESDCKEWSRFYDRVVETTYPNLSPAQIEWSDALFHDFLDHDQNFEFEPVLIHGDFDTSNILVDSETFEVTGIIDFEETRMYDPAADFLFQREGAEFLTPILKTYPKVTDARFQQRMSFRYGRVPFLYILSGLDFGIEGMVTCGYQLLNERVRKWDIYTSVLTESFSALLR